MRLTAWKRMVDEALEEHGDLELLVREHDGRVQIGDPRIARVSDVTSSWFLTVSDHDFPPEVVVDPTG